MKKLLLSAISTLLLLSGCSRTPDDVIRWETTGNIEKLIDALEDPKVEIRMASADALGSLKADRAVRALGALYNDADQEAVLSAIKALANIGTDSTATPLIAALKIEDRQARLLAAEGLGNLGSPRGIDALATALNDTEQRVRLAAAQALGQIGNEQGAPPLINKLTTEELCSAVVDALVALGHPAVPHLLAALQSEEATIRREAINILEELSAVPSTGSNRTWFLLARVSVETPGEIDPAVISALASSSVETLLSAAAHPVSDFREHAFQTLENCGEPCVKQAISAAEKQAKPKAQAWFYERTRWIGAPDWRIDLWAATAALNPAFGETREAIPVWIALLNKPHPREAKQKLTTAGPKALFPLIAASTGEYPMIADHAAELLGNLGDPRAAQPMMDVFKRKLAVNTALSNSPFYTALQQLDTPDAEPLLLRVRPNSLRAMRVFERQYPHLRAISTECRDDAEGINPPISFRIGYVDNGKMDEFTMTFARNWRGNWTPDPALPDHLSR